MTAQAQVIEMIEQVEVANDDNIGPEKMAEYARIGEALIFASQRPLSNEELKSFFPGEIDIQKLMEEVAATYEGRGFQLVNTGGRWSFRTASDLAPYLQKEREVSRKLTRAQTETLAIVAYHQPVTRAEIEEIRGVSVGQGTIELLLQAGWIKPGRRKETPGRPLTWITTEDFVSHFGLSSLEDLPGFEELKAAGLLDKDRPTVLPLLDRDMPANDADADTEESNSEEL